MRHLETGIHLWVSLKSKKKLDLCEFFKLEMVRLQGIYVYYIYYAKKQ